jgi:hypothetical protein
MRSLIAGALAVMLWPAIGPVAAQSARDDPPGSNFQDRGLIELRGEQPVLTPYGYRAYRPDYYGNYRRHHGNVPDAYVPRYPRDRHYRW